MRGAKKLGGGACSNCREIHMGSRLSDTIYTYTYTIDSLTAESRLLKRVNHQSAYVININIINAN
jgi:hypothetical protein